MKFINKNTTIVFLSLFSLMIYGCNEQKLKSKWRTQNIIIDGKNTEWNSGTLIKAINGMLSIYNDNEYLYIGILSSDKKLPIQIMRGGLTVWINREGDNNKNFGIRFPIGFSEPGIRFNDDNEDRNPDIMRENIPVNSNQYEILENDNIVETNITMHNTGIQIKVNPPHEKFLFEMRVPLKESGSDNFAIGTDTSKTISIGFQTEEMDHKNMRGKMHGGKGDFPGGGQDDRPSGERRPMGEGRPDMRSGNSELSEPLDIWFEVKLSSNK